MKKKFFMLFFISNIFFAQNTQIQTLIPEKIFIGDTAELHYSFKSKIDFFCRKDIFEKQLNLSLLEEFKEENNFFVKEAFLQKNGELYTFIIIFIPWQTGKITLPKLDLTKAVFGNNFEEEHFFITFDSFSVNSVLKDPLNTEFKAPMPPKLIPGTSYIIYALILFTVIIIWAAVYLFFKRDIVYSKIKTYFLLRKYKRNADIVLKELKKLLKSQKTDKEFCSILQRAMKNYLSFRFGCNFHTIPSSHFSYTFKHIFSGMLGGKIEEQTEAIERIFRRMDYIKFAQGSIDSMKMPKEEFQTVLSGNEKFQIVSELKNAVLILENRIKID